MTQTHLGDLVELYALGALDSDEVAFVNEHAAQCTVCTAALGEAERTITLLDDETIPQIEPPARLAQRIAASSRVVTPLRRRAPAPYLSFAALAASLALIVGGSAVTRDYLGLRAGAAQDDAALPVIANSHFLHATFTSKQADAPVAKVLWGRTTRWLYVIVDSGSCNCHVIMTDAGGEHDLGTPLGRGATSTLYVPNAPGARGVELRNGSTVLSSANLK